MYNYLCTVFIAFGEKVLLVLIYALIFNTLFISALLNLIDMQYIILSLSLKGIAGCSKFVCPLVESHLFVFRNTAPFFLSFFAADMKRKTLVIIN